LGLAPETNLNQPLENLFKGIGRPITAVRFYKNNQLLLEYQYEVDKVRGA